jgi:hypothetical protein
MDATLTIRMNGAQRKALRNRARSMGRRESDLVREIIARELEERPVLERVQHLITADVPGARRRGKKSWREQIRRRNWRD